ncbi:hypothetical protein Nepgr_009552 [Nepenthes gracilis]|uniref:Uncharacterized protein n=1 Tax=Nepenthes gracilis TaxID=150966 RepID=A0AAD3SBM7_NEPGR|nr:hypothetical protein Nepgr_009552 [Nepenthes gracilis]
MRDADMVIIADSFPLLEELDISGLWYAVTDKGVDALSSILGSFRKINLSGNYCTSSGMTSNGISTVLRNSKSLNSLVLSGKQINSVGSRALSTLVFGTMKILDKLLDSIVRAGLPLKTLKLINCSNYIFAGISSLLQRYQSLECLALTSVEFLTVESMKNLCQFIVEATSRNLSLCRELSTSTFLMLVESCSLLRNLCTRGTSLGRGRVCFEEELWNNLP